MSEADSTSEPIEKYPEGFDPFYDCQRVGGGSFGQVFKAQTREGYFSVIPKVRPSYHHICLFVDPMEACNNRFQTNSEEM